MVAGEGDCACSAESFVACTTETTSAASPALSCSAAAAAAAATTTTLSTTRPALVAVEEDVVEDIGGLTSAFIATVTVGACGGVCVSLNCWSAWLFPDPADSREEDGGDFAARSCTKRCGEADPDEPWPWP